MFSYLDTQLTRLGGPNFAEIPINRPVAPVHNHQQDGAMRTTINTGKALYHPNSVGGGCPMLASASAGAYVHHMERVEGHKIRERSASFKDHYSQAAMFFRSLSPPEQQHLVEACQFELGKVGRTQIRERVLEHFARIDTDLAAAVARGLGLDMPRGKEAPVRAKPSPALSMANTVRDTVKGRRVAALVAPGVRGQDVLAIKRALDKGGAQLEVVAPALGSVATDNGVALEATKSLLTVKSVLFDAVVVPGGAASIATLTANRDAREFLSEANKHFKPIGALGEGTTLLRAAGVPGEGPGDTPPRKGVVGSHLGVVVADVAESRAFADALVQAIAQHRHWERGRPAAEAKRARGRES